MTSLYDGVKPTYLAYKLTMKLSKNLRLANLMNIKTLLLPGTLMFMLAVSPAIPYFSNVAQAQTGHEHKWSDQLGLTDAQKEQIKQIRDNAKQQLDNIFTSDQKTELQQARQQHTKPNLNLTDDQKAQIKKIRQDSESQINALLTPEQQQKLQQMRQQRWQRHHQQQ